jgi:predicted transcriptional regulator
VVGKRVKFDDETWEAVQAVARDSDSDFQELADEAFADLLKKHKQPVGLKAALTESVKKRGS